MNIKGKRALIFGLKRSGVGAARILKGLGAEVAVTDMLSEAELSAYIKDLPEGVRLFLGGHPDEALRGVDLIVVSPGVPLDIEPFKRAAERGIKVIGELELAYRVVEEDGKGEKPFYAVTGSNGKSTTTSLLYHMLRNSGFGALLGGNIGNALTEELYKNTDFDSVCVEVSSFQLESIEMFRPKIASILNITPDHMDRYRSMDEYAEAKARMFLNQKEGDFLVLNRDDPETMKLFDLRLKNMKKGPEVFFFSRKEHVRGVYLDGDKVVCSLLAFKGASLINRSEINIKGVHNLENAMAASAMALLAKCPPEAVVRALREFAGLEHRLELVRELDGVRYINDSKGTNVGAVIKSLESFSDPVILIAGGRDKAGDFSALRSFVKGKVKAVLLIGEASGKIANALNGFADMRFMGDLKEAVSVARKLASQGDVVLLSPACASFDMFRDFEDRGKKFKEEVMRL